MDQINPKFRFLGGEMCMALFTDRLIQTLQGGFELSFTGISNIPVVLNDLLTNFIVFEELSNRFGTLPYKRRILLKIFQELNQILWERLDKLLQPTEPFLEIGESVITRLRVETGELGNTLIDAWRFLRDRVPIQLLHLLPDPIFDFAIFLHEVLNDNNNNIYCSTTPTLTLFGITWQRSTVQFRNTQLSQWPAI